MNIIYSVQAIFVALFSIIYLPFLNRKKWVYVDSCG